MNPVLSAAGIGAGFLAFILLGGLVRSFPIAFAVPP